jgi:hypothetical protein
VSQWHHISIVFDLFCLMVSFKIPNAVELSVWRGVGGCVWPISVSVTLCVKARSNFLFGCGGDHLFDDGSDIKDGSIQLVLLGGFVAQEKQTSEAASCV